MINLLKSIIEYQQVEIDLLKSIASELIALNEELNKEVIK